MKCFTFHLLEVFFDQENRSWVDEHNQLWDGQRNYDISAKLATSVFLILTNGLMIFGIINTNKKLHLVKKLFLYSSAWGVVTGLIVPYYASVDFFSDSCLHEAIGYAVLMFVFFIDFLTLLTIGMVRFMALRYPLKQFRNHNVYVWLAVEFIAAACISVIGQLAFTSNTKKVHTINWLSYGIFTSVCMCLSTILIITLKCTLHNNSLSTDPKYLSKQRRAVYRLFSIGLIYVVCTIPTSSTLLYIGIHLLRKPSHAIQLSREIVLVKWFYNICISYSGFNSVIYIGWDKKIKKYYFHLFCGKNT